MGELKLPKNNNYAGYQGQSVAHNFKMKNYCNKNAVKYVIDDILRNRPIETETYNLLGYGAWGVNYFLSVEDIIATLCYVQKAYDIEHRRGRRIYHEVFWLTPEDLSSLGWNVELMWKFASEVSCEFFYKNGFQVVFAIHYSLQGKYHIHFAVNTINFCTGMKFNSFEKDRHAREIICNEILSKYFIKDKSDSRSVKPLYFGVYKGGAYE